ncbi:MAG TPA: glutamate--tRNA ligase [Candidatus Saccharimonadales bacterium]|nr:glutamate--tRNA ligase [Candidatus Saccharimonadales bacterium]
MIRTRIAPSPTGIPHSGTTRTALFNYLWAKKNKGRFLLRIEDTDQARKVEGAEKSIEEILSWLGLSYDEKYTQSDRLDLYKKYADQLLEKDLAYQDEGAIRFKMPKEGTTSLTDAIGGKHISFENKDQEDFIILKSDGFPTYNFANVIDDHLMEISHVIRGEEFISSTPKHIQLYNAFGWDLPVFAHLPVILGNDKKKLSKRHGAASALEYREQGYLKEALLNYMAFLGWRPAGDEEIISASKMEEIFDLSDVNTASPIFDLKKLEWINGMYIRNLSLENLKEQLIAFYENDKDVSELLNGKNGDMFVAAAQSRMKTLADFKTLVTDVHSDRKKSTEEKEIAQKLVRELEKTNELNGESLLELIRNFGKTNSVSFKTIYFLLTGREQGLPLLELLKIYGKDYFLKNLQNS